MLAKRIIPCLDVKDGRVVKGIKFKGLKDAGDPAKLARFYYEQGADELDLLDITATLESRQTMLKIVERVAEQLFIPLTVGGGIRSIQDITNILRAGADKVAINTAAVKNPGLISQAAEKFGSQCVIIAVDAAKTQGSKLKCQNHNLKLEANGESKQSWEVVVRAGTIRTGLEVIEWVREVEKLGAGEILLTSIDRDGTRAGYDLELLRAVAESVNIPAIASGGAGSKEDVLKALTIGRADAALVASLFHYRDISIYELKRYLLNNGVKIRI